MSEFLEKLKRNAERWKEIKHLADRRELTSTGYAHKVYTVRMDDETRALTDQDLIVLCDDGNACFGGSVHGSRRYDETVSVRVHTD